MATAQLPAEQRFVLLSADWNMYKSFLEALGDRPVRLTFDRGRLEFMTLSMQHERFSNILAQFIEVLTDELDLPRLSAGSTTLNKETLEKGLEPDQCYYLENEPLVRDNEEIDLNVDPPPDLAIEVDVSRSSINRLGIYKAMKIPEVWRFDGENITIYNLLEDDTYQTGKISRHFPFLPIGDLEGFLQKRTAMSETQLIRSFRTWVREQIAAGWPVKPS